MKKQDDPLVRLDKEKAQLGGDMLKGLSGLKKETKGFGIGKKDGLSPSAGSFDSATSSLDAIAREVLNAMSEDSVPPLPKNYQLYFDRIVDEKSADIKKQIMQYLELESDNDDKRVEIEKRVKDSFMLTKQILQNVGTLYKNLNLMVDIIKKKSSDLSATNNSLTAQNIVSSFQGDLSKLTDILSKQSVTLKELYHQSATIVKEVEQETIFDPVFGVNNKRYLLLELDKEIKAINKFNHTSAIVMAKLSKELGQKIDNEKNNLLVTRTVAKLLLKTSRRSDIIAHYGDGIFCMLLKHTNMFSAKKASERLQDMVASTNFFLGDREIQLDISIGIAKVDISRTAEESLSCALNSLEKADADSSLPYVVCSKDEEQ